MKQAGHGKEKNDRARKGQEGRRGLSHIGLYGCRDTTLKTDMNDECIH